MAKPFPNFPAGARGVGILTARLSGAALLLAGGAYPALPGWVELPAVIVGLALAAGVCTRAAAAAAALLILVASATIGGPLGFVLACNAMHVGGLALVGAGAYSIDGLLFGRRVIRLGE